MLKADLNNILQCVLIVCVLQVAAVHPHAAQVSMGTYLLKHQHFTSSTLVCLSDIVSSRPEFVLVVAHYARGTSMIQIHFNV